MREIREARVNDMCIMLKPGLKDAPIFEKRQRTFQNHFKGVLHEEAHLTTHRFSLKAPFLSLPDDFFDLLKSLTPLSSVIAEDIFITHQPFWDKIVLRAKVRIDSIFAGFIASLDKALNNLGAVFHYPESQVNSFRPVTLLSEITHTDISAFKEKIRFPIPLFSPGRIHISRILGQGIFEDVENIFIESNGLKKKWDDS